MRSDVTAAGMAGALKELSHHIGLRGFEIDHLVEPMGAGVTIRLSRTFSMRDLIDQQGAIAALRKIAEDIEQSPAVKEQLDALTKRAEAAEAKVKDLDRYKTYFQVEYALRHGKAPVGL